MIRESQFQKAELKRMEKIWKERNFFLTLAISGVTIQFALQAMINMGSSLHLIPTKGMTLPFLSYGGSSLLAVALGMGIILGFTKRRLDDKGL